MTRSPDTSRTDEIARVAHAIWESEGRPDGRDHDHWMQAKQIVEEGRAGEFPDLREPDGDASFPGHEPREVQPGFEDAAPGITPRMKQDPAPELDEDAGGRFAQQLADLPEGGGGEAESGEAAAAAPKKRATSPRTGAKKGAGADKKPAADKAAEKTAEKDESYVRPAGRKEMELPPSSWTKTDEEADESFPASDPPGNY